MLELTRTRVSGGTVDETQSVINFSNRSFFHDNPFSTASP